MAEDVNVPGLLGAISEAYREPLVLIARMIGVPTPGVPSAWQPVIAGTTRAERVEAALGLWSQEMRELLPEFWDVLADDVYDAVVVRRAGEPALLYVLRTNMSDGTWDVRGWFGFAPYEDPEEPLGWSLHPEPMRRFLREVHGGVASEDGESLGIRRPADWVTLAAYLGYAEGHPDWPAKEIDQRRLYVFGTQDYYSYVCVSPDAPQDTAAFIYEFAVDPEPYSTCVDEFLTGGVLQSSGRPRHPITPNA